MTGIDVLACSIFVAQLSVSEVVLETLQAGEDSEARWHAEALPPSYVSRYLRGRVVASRCAIGSGFTSAETLQHKDHRTALRASLQSETRTVGRRVVALNFTIKTQSIPKGQRD